MVSASGSFTAFRIDPAAALAARVEAASDIPLAWPTDLAHLPAPALPLTFSDRFALLGAELENATARPGEQLQLVTYWEVLAADPSPVVAFAHLTSNGQDLWGQHDWLDVWADGLQPGDRFMQIHSMQVKPETPAGLSYLELGLYNPETLMRLQIATEGKGIADRIWIGEAIQVIR